MAITTSNGWNACSTATTDGLLPPRHGRPQTMTELTPDLLLKAYAIGVFPMADDRNAEEIFWVDPDHRGIVPLDQFHVPRSLRKVLRRGTFTVTVDRAFAEVIAACDAHGVAMVFTGCRHFRH